MGSITLEPGMFTAPSTTGSQELIIATVSPQARGVIRVVEISVKIVTQIRTDASAGSQRGEGI